MIVRFFEMLRDGPVVVGDIRLEDGTLVIDPADRRALVNLITEEFRVGKTGPKGWEGWVEVLPKDQPEAFLRDCLQTYRGSYFWAKEVRTDGTTR